MLRYSVRPILAEERLKWVTSGQRLLCHIPKPMPDGQTALSLTPWLDRVAVLIPPPRRHRHRYHGVLAPTVLPGAKGDSAVAAPRPAPAHFASRYRLPTPEPPPTHRDRPN
ncbi:MAG: transposase [Pseudomonadota bacterium]|nr:transposase [Pseudomonadota bacterium]